MADVAKLSVEVEGRGIRQTSGDLQDLTRSSQGAERQTERTGGAAQEASGSFQSMGSSVGSFIATAVGIATVTATVTRLTQASARAAMEFERLEVGFRVMVGSAEGATDLMSDLTEFAASTPLAVGVLADAAQQLISFGTEADVVTDKLQMLGDIALGDAQKLQRLTRAFGRVQARGRATMQEINTIMEAGVPIIDQLAEGFGVTGEAIFDMISAGEIGFSDLKGSLQALTSEGGVFHKGMEQLSETLEGRLSTAADNFRLLGNTMFEPAMDGVKDFIDLVIDATSGFREFLEENRRVTDRRRELASGDIGTVSMDERRDAEAELEVVREIEGRIREIRGQLSGLGADAAQWQREELEAQLEEAEARLDIERGRRRIAVEVVRQYERQNAEMEAQRYVQGLIERGNAVREEQESRIADELERQREIQRKNAEERIDADTAYREEVAKTHRLFDLGMIDQAEKVERLLSASEAFADSLVGIGYQLDSLGTDEEWIGDEQLQELLQEIPELESRLRDYVQAEQEAEEAQRKRRDMMMEGQRVTEAYRTDQERLADEVKRMDELFQEGAISFETYARAMNELGGETSHTVDELDQLLDDLQRLGEEMAASAWVDTFTAVGEALASGADGADTFAEAMAELGTRFLNELPMMLTMAGLQLIVHNPSLWPIGLGLIAAGGVTAVGAGSANVAMSRNAQGNVISDGAVVPYASGGIVNSPTLFPMRGGTGLMGEDGPEAILPLSRRPGGDLGVKASVGAGDVNIVINNHSGEPVERREMKGPGGERQVEIQIGGIVKKQIVEGRLDSALQQRFGIRNRGVR